MPHREDIWHDRGYLPHCDHAALTQFITYRLDDALPPNVRRKIENVKSARGSELNLIDLYLDSGYGSCLLGIPQNADIIVENWKFFHEKRYLLHAWCVMPNHVHVLFEPLGTFATEEIVHSWKSYTAKRLVFEDEGPSSRGTKRVWQIEYFDRFIRSGKHFAAVTAYIHHNPVKAGLAVKKEDWRWSSAREHGHRKNF